MISKIAFLFLYLILLVSFSSCRSTKSKSVSDPKEQSEINVPSGAPAYPGLIHYEMPDGYVLEIYLRGDERSHIALTRDGYRIDFDSQGYYVYVLKDDDGGKVLSEIIARNPDDRTPEEWEAIGEPGY